VTHAALRSIARLFQALPESAAIRLGQHLGLLTHDILRIRRTQVDTALRQAFGNNGDHARIRRANYAHYGTVLAEFLRLPTLSNEQLLDRFTITGLDHVKQAQAEKKGLIVLTAHVGNWEYLAAAQAALDLDIAVITRHAHQKGVDRFWQEQRINQGVKFLGNYRSLKSIVRHLRAGGSVGMSIDQNEGGTTGARVPFFNREAGTVKAPALLSSRLNCPVIMALSWRDDQGHHHASFSEPIPLLEGKTLADTVDRTTRHYNALLEAFIREHPEQWTWVHRRWKPA